MRVSVQRLHPNAHVPAYAHGDEDAALDIHTIEGGALAPGERRAFRTGLAFALPPGTVGLVWDRSGLAFTNGVTTLGGLIDPGYRGELKICLLNTGREPYEVHAGDRIAQYVILRADRIVFEEVAELPSSQRGTSAFGSSGT